jgi:hypothetical protein
MYRADTSEATDFFAERLKEFLHTRLVSSTASSELIPPTGFRVRVFTQRQGLRIRYSPSYFLNTSLVFGGPTTPAVGWLDPGRYLFGAESNDFDLRFDSANFDIPQVTDVPLTIA